VRKSSRQGESCPAGIAEPVVKAPARPYLRLEIFRELDLKLAKVIQYLVLDIGSRESIEVGLRLLFKSVKQ
jgi:hypothetical protein